MDIDLARQRPGQARAPELDVDSKRGQPDHLLIGGGADAGSPDGMRKAVEHPQRAGCLVRHGRRGYLLAYTLGPSHVTR